MNDENSTPSPPDEPQPRWQPINATDRRVLGVLAEKAKTTPDGYPLSLNAVRTGCNQKSNRAPVMNLEAEDIEESLDRLRGMGAVGLVEGYGRVSKYRHYLYEWLGVDKTELAVMAELLLRGAQTQGELRGRAARMEPIRDLAELKPVVASLKSKGLVIPLTPEGRGHTVTHALYKPRELEQVKAQYGGPAPAMPATAQASGPAPSAPSVPPPSLAATQPPVAQAAPAVDLEIVEALRREIEELRSQVSELRTQLEDATTEQQRLSDDLRDLRDSLGA